jgi:hypothetical protein
MCRCVQIKLDQEIPRCLVPTNVKLIDRSQIVDRRRLGCLAETFEPLLDSREEGTVGVVIGNSGLRHGIFLCDRPDGPETISSSSVAHKLHA